MDHVIRGDLYGLGRFGQQIGYSISSVLNTVKAIIILALRW